MTMDALLHWLAWTFAVGGIAAGLALFVTRRIRRRREKLELWLRQINQLLPLKEAKLVPFPAPSLGGYYFQYPITLECDEKEGGVCWKIHSELYVPWVGRTIFHGDGRPGKMRELYGTDIVMTDDSHFDRHVLVSSTEVAQANLILGPYLRARFLSLTHTHFQISIRDQSVYAECLTPQNDILGPLPHFIDVLISLCAMSDLAHKVAKDELPDVKEVQKNPA